MGAKFRLWHEGKNEGGCEKAAEENMSVEMKFTAIGDHWIMKNFINLHSPQTTSINRIKKNGRDILQENC
jgi:hypothetical protein